MTKISYPKLLKSFADEIALFKQRGLVFTDDASVTAFKSKYSDPFPPSLDNRASVMH